ncbi:MAG: phosphomannose isomerase type II C-terminal cupin domain [Woeseiaceae bacterium]|jgi:mannose-1-phosphate guanylyltransferase/mannose-6-phosphate isomerase|nr:phosphomannose isomerase type II C-terminal cupin domain [Woeseiaceae bacterium]|tara:strand:+ start:346 stop:717 length:372 start_codon:yes stop_codon:yes gene_type:complete
MENELHKEYFRPWGSYICLDSGSNFQVKRLIVNPGGILSLQKHFKRSEHWTVVSGVASVTLDKEEFKLKVNETIYIPIESIHRISNKSPDVLEIIEVQCGEYLGEDDIVRFEDNYGRVENDGS